MTTLELLHPVYTLDGTLLTPARTSLSRDALEKVIDANQDGSYDTISLMDYGTIREDLLLLLKRAQYSLIFSDQKQTGDLMRIMGRVSLIVPVLHTLDYFKRYDFYTYSHILSVFALTTLLAEGMVEDYSDRIREAAAGPIHDIGKICVPLPILQKTVPLTLKDRELLEHHSSAGYALLSYYLKDPDGHAARVARDHHEKRDGSGYPRGIPLTDRLVEIIAVCDVYDALISPRPYRPVSYDNRTALEEITRMAESGKLGWETVQALVACNRKDKPHFSECTVSRMKRGTPPKGNIYGMTAEEKHSDKN
jgi:HD-GYP domain-containing protein (c-di-GMP phosphodiesterase class II)